VRSSVAAKTGIMSRRIRMNKGGSSRKRWGERGEEGVEGVIFIGTIMLSGKLTMERHEHERMIFSFVKVFDETSHHRASDYIPLFPDNSAAGTIIPRRCLSLTLISRGQNRFNGYIFLEGAGVFKAQQNI
jgi:hypothetical protein